MQQQIIQTLLVCMFSCLLSMSVQAGSKKSKNKKSNKTKNSIQKKLIPKEEKVILTIRPVPVSELSIEKDILVEFSVENASFPELSRTQYPRACVLKLPILAQAPKYYLGNSTLLVSQTDLRDYGLKQNDQSMSTTLADGQDVQSVIASWQEDSQAISFSELDKVEMGKFINELSKQLNSNETQNCANGVSAKSSSDLENQRLETL
jgi:hypothetical protein